MEKFYPKQIPLFADIKSPHSFFGHIRIYRILLSHIISYYRIL